MLGAEGAGGAAEQLRQEAVVAAHAADGGLGGGTRTRLAVAPHGNYTAPGIDRSQMDGWSSCGMRSIPIVRAWQIILWQVWEEE